MVTYRLIIKYPSSLKDPALKIKIVASAYKLYANDKLIAEVGKVSDKLSVFKESEKPLIADLPTDTQKIELVFQVANLNYAKGGLRDSLIFGSKQVLVRQGIILLSFQLLFIGSILIFGIYYLLLFILQKKNSTALFFSIFCFITALRSLIWGELPLMIFSPNLSYDVLGYINYATGYNMIPVMLLFVRSIYPLEYKKKILRFVLLPTLLLDILLVLMSPAFMSRLTNLVYILVLLQLVYIIIGLARAVLKKRDNAALMYITVCLYFLTVNQDILRFKGISGINLTYMFLYGSFSVIIAMCFIQAKQQATSYKKLALFNEKLIEADKLKDKIMATEMSFLQAQIKPHFLYNALDAIANVCEKDGKKGGKLIIDLAIYLRNSLEFNNLDKMSTIEKELEFIDTYFNIEKARFGEKIKLLEEIEIPLNEQIPVFILQPVVENAVRHGISKKLGGGTVTVKLRKINEDICLEIEDDGVGMNSEKLATLLCEEKEGSSVGLLNIHNRLLRMYGRGLEVSSELGCGTCVKLVIPEGGKPNDKSCSGR